MRSPAYVPEDDEEGDGCEAGSEGDGDDAPVVAWPVPLRSENTPITPGTPIRATYTAISASETLPLVWNRYA